MAQSAARGRRIRAGTSCHCQRLRWRRLFDGRSLCGLDCAPNNEQVRHQNDGERHRWQEGEHGAASVNDLQRKHSSNESARKHPEQQLSLFAGHIAHRPATKMDRQESCQQQRRQNPKDGNDVRAADELGHNPEHDEEEGAHQEAYFRMEGMHSQALANHVRRSRHVSQRDPEDQLSQQSASARITSESEDAKHNSEVQNVAVRQTADERPKPPPQHTEDHAYNQRDDDTVREVGGHSCDE